MFNIWDLEHPYSNPKSLNFYSLWFINHISIRLVKTALIKICLTTFGTYSDRRRFFSMKSHYFFRLFFQKMMAAAEGLQLWFLIQNIVIYRLLLTYFAEYINDH